jgi:hypothetical protein
MNEPKVTNQAPSQDETPKQPYEKPAVIYRAPLEAVAGLCTDTGAKATPPPGGSCTILQS